MLSTVLTTISSGVYCDTSKRNFNFFSSPSSWMSGEWRPVSQSEDAEGGVSALHQFKLYKQTIRYCTPYTQVMDVSNLFSKLNVEFIIKFQAEIRYLLMINDLIMFRLVIIGDCYDRMGLGLDTQFPTCAIARPMTSAKRKTSFVL